MKHINALAAAALVLGCGTVNAGLISVNNAGFENGLTGPGGWTTRFTSTTTIAQVVTSHISEQNPPNGGNTIPYTYYPQERENFLMLGSGGSGPTTWQSVTQSFTVNAKDDILSGYAAFDWNDVPPGFDGAKVTIYQGTFTSRTYENTPFSMNGTSFTNPNPPPTYLNYANGPWTLWNWIAPAAGAYTLEYAVRNTANNRVNSYGYFDTVPATVPEPVSLALFIVGLASLSAMQRRKTI